MNGYRLVMGPILRKAPHVVAGFWDSALEAKADVIYLKHPLTRDPRHIVRRTVANGLPKQ